MSIVAEFARNLHETSPKVRSRELHPLTWPCAREKATDIRAIIFDVYGTLFNYWKPEYAVETSKNEALLQTFRKTINFFGLAPYLQEMDPAAKPEKTLWDLYHGLIAIKHKMLLEKDVEFPEVKIEEVWNAVLLMVKRRGYVYNQTPSGDDDANARCIAYYYNFNVFGRELYPGVAQALETLKTDNMLLGMVSNAQFYTPIDLTLLLRDQSDGRIEDMGELFEPDLVFFSYEYAMAKPSPLLFRKLFDALYELQILPEQTLFVGNDLASDIAPAQEAGMKTALFTGDDQCSFTAQAQDRIPDITFDRWSDLPGRISFFQGQQRAD